jgi:hypothetical protein
VVAVATVLLLVGLGNLARGSLAITSARRLPDLPLTASWTYLAATGLFWGLAFGVLSFCLASFRPWARVASLASATVFQTHVWVNHLLYDANEYARRTWPRDLLLTALFLGIVVSVLSWPSVRREFRVETG